MNVYNSTLDIPCILLLNTYKLYMYDLSLQLFESCVRVAGLLLFHVDGLRMD